MRTSVKPLVFLLGAVLLWGTSYAVTKSAYSALAPMQVVWGRMLMALVAFLPLLRVVRRPAYRAGDWKLILVAVLSIPCLYYTFEGFAIKFTTSSQAGMVTAVAPLIVALTAWAALHEHLTRRTVVAAFVSVAGVAVLSFGGDVAQVSASNPVLGNLLELGAMLSAAGSTLSVKRLAERYDPVLLTGMQMAAGAVFFAPLALASGPIHVTAVPAGDWLAMAYLGVGCGLGAFGLYNSSLCALPASRAALALNVVPAVALATGWVALGETMSGVQIAACLVILVAVVFAQWRPRQKP